MAYTVSDHSKFLKEIKSPNYNMDKKYFDLKLKHTFLLLLHIYELKYKIYQNLSTSINNVTSTKYYYSPFIMLLLL